MYKKLKKQNGEAFAQTIRNHHNGLLEIPNLDEIVRYAGRDAQPLLPYLMSLLETGNDNDTPPPTEDAIALLNRAGYDAFYADSLEKQNSIKRYFAKGELLCTFNDHARYQDYHIIHAIRKDADEVKRDAFDGKEDRQDSYGTSVISIQILKTGGFISIKNRYNHTVAGCDNTFGSNPDRIIKGLSGALKEQFNVDFSVPASELSNNFTLVGHRIFKFHSEKNNYYYGDQAWAKDGVIHNVDRAAGDAMFDLFLFDNKSKSLKRIDPLCGDNFSDSFNEYYGGNRSLNVQGSSLTLKGKTLIGAEQARIKTLYLPDMIKMKRKSLAYNNGVVEFDAPQLKEMGAKCFYNAHALKIFKGASLTHMDDYCLFWPPELEQFNAPSLKQMGRGSLNAASDRIFFKTRLQTKIITPIKSMFHSFGFARP